MERNRKLVVVCHCILNCNSKSRRAFYFEGTHSIVSKLIEEGYGIIQLPCPEMIMYGIKRWGHTKNNLITYFIEINVD